MDGIESYESKSGNGTIKKKQIVTRGTIQEEKKNTEYNEITDLHMLEQKCFRQINRHSVETGILGEKREIETEKNI